MPAPEMACLGHRALSPKLRMPSKIPLHFSSFFPGLRYLILDIGPNLSGGGRWDCFMPIGKKARCRKVCSWGHAYCTVRLVADSFLASNYHPASG